MHKRAVTCSMCGGQFFPASLKHHQKVCARRQGTVLVPCRFCQEEFPKPELEAHLARCPAAPKSAKQDASNGGRIDTGLTNDGRMECPTCGRKFLLDRIAKHSTICSRVNAKDRPTYDSFAQRKIPGAQRVVLPTESENRIRLEADQRRRRQQKLKSSVLQGEAAAARLRQTSSSATESSSSPSPSSLAALSSRNHDRRGPRATDDKNDARRSLRQSIEEVHATQPLAASPSKRAHRNVAPASDSSPKFSADDNDDQSDGNQDETRTPEHVPRGVGGQRALDRCVDGDDVGTIDAGSSASTPCKESPFHRTTSAVRKGQSTSSAKSDLRSQSLSSQSSVKVNADRQYADGEAATAVVAAASSRRAGDRSSRIQQQRQRHAPFPQTTGSGGAVRNAAAGARSAAVGERNAVTPVSASSGREGRRLSAKFGLGDDDEEDGEKAGRAVMTKTTDHRQSTREAAGRKKAIGNHAGRDSEGEESRAFAELDEERGYRKAISGRRSATADDPWECRGLDDDDDDADEAHPPRKAAGGGVARGGGTLARRTKWVDRASERGTLPPRPSGAAATSRGRVPGGTRQQQAGGKFEFIGAGGGGMGGGVGGGMGGGVGGGGFLPTNDTSLDNPMVSPSLLHTYARYQNEKAQAEYRERLAEHERSVGQMEGRDAYGQVYYR